MTTTMKKQQKLTFISRLTMFKLGVIFLLLLGICEHVSVASKDEEQLLTDLFLNYNTLTRPVMEQSETLDVYIGIAINQIIDLDVKNEKIILSMQTMLEWYDDRLQWETNVEYANVSRIRVPSSKIWTPDIILFNRAEEEVNDVRSKFLIMVRSFGLCALHIFSIASAICNINISWFPFDDQICTLEYQSATYSSDELNLNFNLTRPALLADNSEWQITKITTEAKEVDVEYAFEIEKHGRVVFSIYLRRKSLYYAVNLILPCAVISALAPLTFLMQTDDGDRIGMGITILLAMSVYQIIVLDKIPTSSDEIPIIGSYFIVLICVSALQILLLVAVAGLRNDKTKPMPLLAQAFIFKFLARLLCMSKPCNNIPPYVQTPSSSSQTSDFISPDQVIQQERQREQSASMVVQECNKQLKIDADWKFTAQVVGRACFAFFGGFQIICYVTLAAYIIINYIQTKEKIFDTGLNLTLD